MPRAVLGVPFQGKQGHLAVLAPTIAARAAIRAHDAVTRHGQGDRVGRAGVGHRADGRRRTDALGDLRVAPPLAPRYPAQLLPDPALEDRAAHIEGELP